MFTERFQILIGIRQIHFVGDNEPGPFREQRIVEIDLAPELLQVFHGIAAFASGDVEDEEQSAASRDVPQKLVAESEPAMRALNQTGNISDRSAAIFGKIDHTDDRMQRREWIWRNFRTRGGNFAKQSRFAGVRIANERGIGDRAQLK